MSDTEKIAKLESTVLVLKLWLGLAWFTILALGMGLYLMLQASELQLSIISSHSARLARFDQAAKAHQERIRNLERRPLTSEQLLQMALRGILEAAVSE